MNIIHFDVDEHIHPYLTGEKYDFSLQEITSEYDFSLVEGITIKTVSDANSKTLKHFPQLKFLITRTVGTDHIDLHYCEENNIAVYHIVDYGAFNIAEHVFALLLSGTRNILSSQTEIKAGHFFYKNFIGIALKGKTLGVIGTGRIGLEVIKRANAFEMSVMAYDVYKNDQAQKELGFDYVELDELLSKSDIITLHAPYLESTHHIIDASAIQQMKDGAILINTARGELIDTEALIQHVKKFRFIGLDVVEGEKRFSKDHPLLQFDNVIITPHIAFFSDASVKKIAEETERLIENYINGRGEEGRVV